MNRRLVVARIISVTGSLLLMVAAIHLLVTPVLKSAILDRVLTLQELRIVSPPFLLNHIVVGVLLIPLGFISLYTASGIRAGERWAWVINLAIGLTILSLPVVLVLVMRAEYFRAVPFLIATTLITIVGITMTAALILVRHDFQSKLISSLGRAEQIAGRERRGRLSQLARCGGGCFESRRRVNSIVRRCRHANGAKLRILSRNKRTYYEKDYLSIVPHRITGWNCRSIPGLQQTAAHVSV